MNSAIQNLVIDLRGNGGGNDDYGKLLLSYLVDKMFRYYQSLTMKSDQYKLVKPMPIPANFIQRNSKTGLWDVKQHPNIGEHAPSKNVFMGKVDVLIDGASFSTTSEFLSAYHHYGKPVFIGEESGGNYYGNNSGFMGDLILTNSGFTVSIPLMHYKMAVGPYAYPGNGVKPNVTVSYTGKDIREKKDPEMETVLDMIQRGQ